MSEPTLWGRQEPVIHRPSLARDLSAPIVVIGAGITGLTTALSLQEEGHDVVVLEMNRVGAGTTGTSSGHLDATTDTGMREVVRDFGESAAREAYQAASRALDRVERWSSTYGIDCDLRRVPGYFYADDLRQAEELDRQADAYERVSPDAERLPLSPPPFGGVRALRIPRQIRFDPLDFVRGLARAFESRGGKVFERTRVQRLHDQGDGVTLQTAAHTIHARTVVLATHGPLFGLLSLQTRAHPYQSYLITVRVRGPVEDALYWDLAEPYHYTRVLHSSDPEVLLIGGADHRTGDESDTTRSFADLEDYARARHDVVEVLGRWSQEYFEPADRLPYIGKLPGRHHTYIATAFSGDGLCWGTVAAEALTHGILGRPSPLLDLFSPARVKPLASAPEMVSAGSKIALHAIGDHLAFADVDRLDEIPNGEGRLIRLGLRRLAVYRDDHGALHGMSPICRHAGCIVQWNGAAKTWDCPCHGGRYDAYGKVIAAPPKDDLPPEPVR